MVKSFALAQKYAPEIEKRVILKASNFLASRQSDSGAFLERGRVIHRDMQGGVDSELTITAYVTIALIEGKLADANDRIEVAVKKALAYLEKQASSVNDTYSLGLLTYALNLGKSEQAKTYFDLFSTKSQQKPDGSKYWPKSTQGPESSSDIELTSYALLLNLIRNDLSSSLSIVRYLVGQSSKLGGYSNTQDTVLALQALSAFGIATNSGSSSTTVRSITTKLALNDANGAELDQKSFTTNDDNSMVLQTWDLPSCGKKIRLSANGAGKALVQITASYNMPKPPDTPMFKLAQTAVKSNNGVLDVRTCVTYNKDSSPDKSDSTGMTIVEATLLSGYEADKHELERLVDEKQVRDLKLTEIKDESVVVFYLDKLDNEEELCIKWKMHKQSDVDNLQGAPLKVYDYYQSYLAFDTVYVPDF